MNSSLFESWRNKKSKSLPDYLEIDSHSGLFSLALVGTPCTAGRNDTRSELYLWVLVQWLAPGYCIPLTNMISKEVRLKIHSTNYYWTLTKRQASRKRFSSLYFSRHLQLSFIFVWKPTINLVFFNSTKKNEWYLKYKQGVPIKER